MPTGSSSNVPSSGLPKRAGPGGQALTVSGSNRVPLRRTSSPSSSVGTDLWQRGDARVLVNTEGAERRDGTELFFCATERPGLPDWRADFENVGATDDGAVRIVLTVGAAPTDDTAHAQHVALATDDVVAAARDHRAAGGELLPIPVNYYDDLAARHEFADGALETYRELCILYDRDAYGTFRHC